FLFGVSTHTDLLSFPTRRSSDLDSSIGGAPKMINDKEFLKFEEGFFKPYFEKFIEFKRGKGEKVASSTLIRFRKLNNSLNQYQTDRKSTRLNSSHVSISYAVFCL